MRKSILALTISAFGIGTSEYVIMGLLPNLAQSFAISIPKAGVIVIGGHLDSWDRASGAIDDGAGIAIMSAAAKHIMDAGRP